MSNKFVVEGRDGFFVLPSNPLSNEALSEQTWNTRLEKNKEKEKKENLSDAKTIYVCCGWHLELTDFFPAYNSHQTIGGHVECIARAQFTETQGSAQISNKILYGPLTSYAVVEFILTTQLLFPSLHSMPICICMEINRQSQNKTETFLRNGTGSSLKKKRVYGRTNFLALLKIRLALGVCLINK